MIDHDHTIRVIRARCCDALTPAEIDAVASALAGRDDATGAISADIAARILEVLEALEARIAEIEEAA
jgi:hypothetical protein